MKQEITKLEKYFRNYRKYIIGNKETIQTPYHDKKRIIYADWTASGRCFAPIEERLQQELMPFVANTHTETNSTGRAMTLAYHQAQAIIKRHVNASKKDMLISCSSGMTGVVNKFQRILGLRVYEKYPLGLSPKARPIIFITHMEHHSNQTSWLETNADVEIVPPNAKGLVCLENFEKAIAKYPNRRIKIASVTACSNVTGITTPYHEIAALMHKNDGWCFVDFACSAPYVSMDMHPKDPLKRLDAIFFSPHKFLGGPGSTGILIFNQELYRNRIPDNVGGGTVEWTNPWKEHRYFRNIEVREDGGTPAFLQTIKAAMCMQLKEEMGVTNILKREKEQMKILWDGLKAIPNLHILAPNHKDRLGVVSFYIEDLKFDLGVKILNDRFGIQVRGGCSCAGTYGHYLLNVDKDTSKRITCMIDQGDYSEKPGWIRLSIHPTMTNKEITYLIDSIQQLAIHHRKWVCDYESCSKSGKIEYNIPTNDTFIQQKVEEWFGRDYVNVNKSDLKFKVDEFLLEKH